MFTAELSRLTPGARGVLPTRAMPGRCWRNGVECVKHENHTPAGAFKVRGGLVYVDRLKRERPETRGPDLGDARQSRPERRFRRPPPRHAGDHRGAARQFGREEPRDAGVRRRAGRARRGFSGGARGGRASCRKRRSGDWCRRSIPISCWELRPMRSSCFRAAPDLDVLYVPIGLGSGICGCILARDLLGLKTEIVGVQSTEAPSYALSFAAGTVVTTDHQQYAGGRHGDARSRCQTRLRSFARALRASSRSATTKSAAAIRAYWTDTHNLAEGAGAAPLAAALLDKSESARQARRPRTERRQYRSGSVSPVGHAGSRGPQGTGVGK